MSNHTEISELSENLLYYPFKILSWLEKFTSCVTNYFKNQSWPTLVAGFLFGKNIFSDLMPAKLIVRLLLIVTLLSIVAVLFGHFLLSKIGWAFQEGKPLTILSFIFLISTGYILQMVWNSNGRRTVLVLKQTESVWWFLSWGFFIAAWDELLRLHETADRQLHKLFGVKPTALTDHLDDVFVGMYGVVGILILWIYRSEILKYRAVWPLFTGSVLLGIISLTIDILCADKPFLRMFFHSPDSLQVAIDVLDVVEEYFKLCTEIMFVGTVAAILKISHKRCSLNELVK